MYGEPKAKVLLNSLMRIGTLPFLVLLVITIGCAEQTGTRNQPDRPESQPQVTTPAPTASPAPTVAPISTAGPTETPPPLGAHACNEQGECGALEFEGYGFLSAAWLDESRMYLGTVAGNIELLDLTTGELTRVAGGLSSPRGLAVLYGQLFVSHAGNSCENWNALADELESEGVDGNLPSLRQCYPKGFDVSGDLETLQRVVRASDGQVVAYLIEPDGSLTGGNVVIDGVPIGEGPHGHNGLATDGASVYGSVGYPANGSKTSKWHQASSPEDILEPGRKRDLMGTVYRFDPHNPEKSLETFASGLRNVYGISVAADGTVWGVDNDGGSDHFEELNAIRHGHDYGFPEYGTGKAPPEAGVTEPFRRLPGRAGTFALASDNGVYYAYTTVQIGPTSRVIDFTAYDGRTHKRVVSNTKTWVTALLENNGLLYVVLYNGRVMAVDPGQSAQTLDEVPVVVRGVGDGPYAFEPDNLEFRAGEIAVMDFQVVGGEHVLFVDGADIFKGESEGLPIESKMRYWPRFEHVFEEPGTYRFVCLIHEDQGMTGTITVSR